MNSNGYNKSLFDTVDGQCYLTKRFTQTVRHEVFQGDPNRKFSKQGGLWITFPQKRTKNGTTGIWKN